MKKNFYFALTALMFLLFPLVIWFINIPLINSTYGKGFKIFEFAGILPTILLIYFYFKNIKDLKENINDLFYNSLQYILYFLYLNFFIDFIGISSDYLCYENAMINYLQDKNIYANTGFIYPPLLTQLMSVFYLTVKKFLLATKINIPEEGIRFLLFYFYNAINFLLIIGSIYLSFKYISQNPFDNKAKIIVFLLFLINNPVFRNIKFNQINFLILFPILLIMTNYKNEYLIGFIVALSILIKLYLILLLLPLIISKKYKILISIIITCMFYFVLNILFEQQQIWRDFLLFFKEIPKNSAFRNNSIHSIINNLTYMLGFGNYIYFLFLSFAYGSIFYLFYKRMLFLLRKQNFENRALKLREEFILIYSISLMLLITPIAWEHHYVIAIPIFLFGLKFYKIINLQHYLICGILMFVIPTFDIFPLSYHRIFGLLLFLYLLNPQKLINNVYLSNLFDKEIKVNRV